MEIQRFSVIERQCSYVSGCCIHGKRFICLLNRKIPHEKILVYYDINQGSPTLFLESCLLVGFCSNPNLAHLILMSSWLIN